MLEVYYVIPVFFFLRGRIVHRVTNYEIYKIECNLLERCAHEFVREIKILYYRRIMVINTTKSYFLLCYTIIIIAYNMTLLLYNLSYTLFCSPILYVLNYNTMIVVVKHITWFLYYYTFTRIISCGRRNLFPNTTIIVFPATWGVYVYDLARF